MRYGLPFRLPVVAGSVFAVRPGGFFLVGVCRGRLSGGKGALKLKRLASGSKTALEQVCRVGVGVFSFWAFIER